MRRRVNLLTAMATASLAVAGAVAVVALAPPAAAATLTEVTNFGFNPSNIRMYEYVPASAPAGAPILVAAHWCGGDGPAMYNGTEIASFADQFGFIVIYPSVTRSNRCWDVASAGALTHNGNSDPAGIRSMVQWEVQNRGADANRVYVTGISSGGMVTNVLLGDYPDVFKAGSAFMGVPFYCFFTGEVGGWNGDCSSGLITKTPQEWGDLVRAAFPGYSGPRPRMQLWHGVLDTGLHYHNFGEEIKQWTNVLGLSQTPTFTDNPASNWTRTRFGGTGTMAPVEGNSFEGVGHSLPLAGQMRLALEFLGLIGGPTATTSRPPTTTTRPATTTSRPPTTTTRPASTTSRPPTATTRPPTTGGSSGCSATYTKVGQWGDGFQGEVRVTNTGTTATTSWTVALTFANGQRITQIWSARTSSTASPYTITNETYNNAIGPNGSATFGFLAGWTGTNTDPTVSCSRTP